MKLIKNLTYFIFFVAVISQAQVGIGTTSPDSEAILDVVSSDKGVILPRVDLVSSTNPSPMSSHVEGMLVYNRATDNDVTPGYYYNSGTEWVTIGDRGLDESSGSVIKKLQYTGAYDGTKTVINGLYEFRFIGSGGSGTGNDMIYQMRLVDTPGTESYTTSVSVLRGIGCARNREKFTHVFDSSNWNTWVEIAPVTIEGCAHMAYISVTPSDSAETPFMYVLNTQRIGDNDPADGLKSLITNRY